MFFFSWEAGIGTIVSKAKKQGKKLFIFAFREEESQTVSAQALMRCIRGQANPARGGVVGRRQIEFAE